MLIKQIVKDSKSWTLLPICRWVHMRGKAPGLALSLEQRLQKEKGNIIRLPKVDIGFPGISIKKSVRLMTKTNLDNANELIDLDLVKNEGRNSTEPYRIKKIAEHYGVFKDLFTNAYFVPRIPLEITYKNSGSTVFNGNVIKPFEAKDAPEISYTGNIDLLTGQMDKKTKNYWSLIFLNPDGNSLDTNGEYCHWFVSNILENDVENGEAIMPYLQPLPLKGVGYQRYIFLLFKQEQKLNFSSYKFTDEQSLDQRFFSMDQFYRKYQNEITPAGLSFFQSNWDESVNEVFHKKYNSTVKEYEYDFPKPYLADQKWFPLRQPFNWYMDKHCDEKELNLRHLKRWLKERHPFKATKSILRYPSAQPIKNQPSWLIEEIKKQRLYKDDKNSIRRSYFM